MARVPARRRIFLRLRHSMRAHLGSLVSQYWSRMLFMQMRSFYSRLFTQSKQPRAQATRIRVSAERPCGTALPLRARCHSASDARTHGLRQPRRERMTIIPFCRPTSSSHRPCHCICSPHCSSSGAWGATHSAIAVSSIPVLHGIVY